MKTGQLQNTQKEMGKELNNRYSSTLRWLFDVPGKKKWYLLFLTLIQMAIGGVSVLFALLFRGLVDSAAKGSGDEFRHYVVLVIVLELVDIALRALNRWLNELSRASLENMLKKRQTDVLLRKDYASVHAIHSGEWMNRLTNDTVVVTTGYVEILPGVASTLVRILTALLILFMIDRLFALVLIPGSLFLIAVTSLFRSVLKRLHKRMQEKDGKVRIFLQERISSLMMIKSFAAEDRTSRDADRYMQAHKDARMRKNYFSNFCNTGLTAALDGLYLGGVIYCGWGILKGTMSYGTLVAAIQLLSQVRSPLVSLTGFLPMYYAMLASAERLMEAESFPDDWQGRHLSPEKAKAFYEDRLSEISLQHATYTYYPTVSGSGALSKENMPIVLNDLTLSIRKGEYVAFTGHSGCGKSTVLKILMSMYPLDSGTKTILCRDEAEIPLTAEYRRLFAYVPQGNQLMNGTIREIVAFSETGKVNEARLEQALRVACADEFVQELEKGTETLLGERGTGLSEGQMQRIAIARALYSEAPILLLDESTSALDAKTEEDLLSNLKQMTNKTVIIVTHRPAALAICDRILHFTESGVHEVK